LRQPIGWFTGPGRLQLHRARVSVEDVEASGLNRRFAMHGLNPLQDLL